MGLFKKKEEEKKLDSILNLKTGIPIEISQLNDKDFAYSHKTKLEEFVSEKEAIILAPMSNGNIVKLSNSTKYSIMFKTNNGLFKNTMKVISYTVKDNIALVKVEILDKSEKLQRRASFRLEVSLNFEYDIVENCNEDTLKNTDILFYKAKTIDISSGGIKFFANEDLKEGQHVKILINVDELFVVAICTIIHKEKSNLGEEYRYSYKCKFENIPKKYQEDLSKYIFDTQRNLSKKGVIFNK
ncbi:flagellar brake protein [[Clostridium] colinum]|uniref:flagellar brake protein n=1 Tax=[Clostridium] colinum TaxID=36835 RepID=UPI00202489FD|nr:PilZ domain-containing protein [[Clostridium] colinum]